mmetsp:Transcript_11697/g.49235  ORF Transcript_11697/g.49235 Transcript_11697/m.49235 type:complete len:275 (-) Transcript_11697:2264-3088(-)
MWHWRGRAMGRGGASARHQRRVEEHRRRHAGGGARGSRGAGRPRPVGLRRSRRARCACRHGRSRRRECAQAARCGASSIDRRCRCCESANVRTRGLRRGSARSCGVRCPEWRLGYISWRAAHRRRRAGEGHARQHNAARQCPSHDAVGDRCRSVRWPRGQGDDGVDPAAVEAHPLGTPRERAYDASRRPAGDDMYDRRRWRVSEPRDGAGRAHAVVRCGVPVRWQDKLCGRDVVRSADSLSSPRADSPVHWNGDRAPGAGISDGYGRAALRGVA